MRKRSSLKVYSFPKDMPDHIDIDVSQLDFHHAVKVADVKVDKLEFLDPKQASIAVVEVPRAAKMAAEEAAAAPAEGDAKAAPAKKDEGKK